MKAVDPQIQQIYDNIATYQAIALQDYGVPEWQALPIASRPDIAFRPSCSQLGPIWQAEGSTAWVWDRQTIYTAPGEMQSTPETLLNLQAAGVCIAGTHAVEVPMVPTDEVFQEFQKQVSGAVAVLPDTQTNVEQADQVVQTETQPTETETTTQARPTPWGAYSLILGAVLLVGGLVLGLKRLKKTAKNQRQKRNSEPALQHPEAPTQTANGAVPLEEEYDFQL